MYIYNIYIYIYIYIYQRQHRPQQKHHKVLRQSNRKNKTNTIEVSTTCNKRPLVDIIIIIIIIIKK